MNKLLLIFISILIISCTNSSGSKFLASTSENQLRDRLVNGITTKEQVKSYFGDPHNVEFLPHNREEWVYAYTKSRAKTINFVPVLNTLYSGTNDNVRRLKIIFNSRGLVERYIFINNKGETLHGAFTN